MVGVSIPITNRRSGMAYIMCFLALCVFICCRREFGGSRSSNVYFASTVAKQCGGSFVSLRRLCANELEEEEDELMYLRM